MSLTLRAEHLSKSFDRRWIFKDISFSIHAGQTLLITGHNGSGKSTLVKILCGVLAPSQGAVHIDGGPASPPRNLMGFVSPYLEAYDEFSAQENLLLASHIRGVHLSVEYSRELLRRVSLSPTRTDPVRTFSSGMKQRLKYALSLAHRPRILLLDEPMANLDDEGIALVRELMDHHRTDGILVVATNDVSDLSRFDVKVDLYAER
jgi:heme exporter protein A